MTVIAEAPRKSAARKPRRGNRRPKLLAPRLQTLFALPPRLLLSRLWRKLAQPLYRSGLYAATLGSRSSGELAALPSDLWPADERNGMALLHGEFRCGAELVRNPKPLSNAVGVSLTWQEWMAGFSWLDDLRALGGPATRQTARQLILAWFAETAAYDSLTWRADLLSARLRRCLANAGFLEVNSDALFRAHLLRSLNRQAEHLSRALPDGLIGAELLKAATSLMLAALLLPQNDRSGEKWLRRGQLLLDRELAAQILPDGGHIERSPTVMLDLLRHLLDLQHAFLLTRRTPPDQLASSIENLASALHLLTHPDGGLALFNDSSEESAEEVALALSRAAALRNGELRDLSQLPQTGFQRVVAGKTVLIADAGAPPPHGYDTHAHAGTLSFELSHGPERIIVNCGAHPVAPEWRAVQGATAAHSTLVVDDTNSSMLLPFGGLALTPKSVLARREATETGQWLDMRHNGYEEPFGLTHRRRLFLSADGNELVGEEILTGRGGNAFALRFHLHPGVQVSVTQNGQAAFLKLPGGASGGGAWRLRIQGGDLDLADSVYLGAKGQVRRSQQLLVLGLIESDETQIKWALQKEGVRR
jgi:uncharacterized heparinase superfamily protein